MSVEENKAIIRRFFQDFLNAGDLAVADELCAADYVLYFPGSPEPMNRQGAKRFLTHNRTAFPDLHFTYDDLIAEGDQVVARFTMRGTHRGEFRGIPPTGRQVTVTGIDIFRIAGGKIVEDRVEADRLGMLQQLGAIPAAGYCARLPGRQADGSR